MITRRVVTALAVAVAATGGWGPGAAGAADYRVRARIEPREVKVGEPATYRGTVTPGNAALQWLPPDSSRWVMWGDLKPSRHGVPPNDTLIILATVQAFLPGEIVIPGIRFRDRTPGRPTTVQALPSVKLRVTSVLTAADSNATLRPVRGPLAAPWWERVPWAWVILGLALIAAIVALVVWLKRRRKKPVAVPIRPSAPTLVRRDPGSEALARLEALRARRLPEIGDFGGHALELTRILRLYLEASTGEPQPGDTTTELSLRLEHLDVSDQERAALVELLKTWDRVKFGRAPSTVADARAAEQGVETFVRRRIVPPPGPAPTPAPPTPEKEAA